MHIDLHKFVWVLLVMFSRLEASGFNIFNIVPYAAASCADIIIVEHRNLFFLSHDL